jgi:2-oxoglutarate dehydrogenase E1 component
MLDTSSLAFADWLFARYVNDPRSIPDDWRALFAAMSTEEARAESSAYEKNGHSSDYDDTKFLDVRASKLVRQERIDDLIRNYRVRGHIVAKIDPLGRTPQWPAELHPRFYGFTREDDDRTYSTRDVPGPSRRTLREIMEWLQNTYCRSIGVQFMHIDELEVRRWLQNRMEKTENRIELAKEQKVRILKRLTDAATFEKFVQTKFAGAKSFSLEGAESLIPLLDLAIEKASSQGTNEIVFAMAHRGRLNVLANIIGKRPRDIFGEFLDVDSPNHSGPGDVKYHLGYSSDYKTIAGSNVHLSLCFNPSHLEFVNPVALGRMRAKQDRFGDEKRRHGLVVLIHGDAAFAGEGITQETLNLSELPGYRVGGALHVIVNNQIGFTTLPQKARSSGYVTDVARMLQIPIFHVNGEDPEAVAQVVDLGLDFRREFQRDVIIDMYCYRLRGHNEGDEPTFTQPVMYREIASRRPVRERYVESLIKLGGVTQQDADQILAQRNAALEQEFEIAHKADFQLTNVTPTGPWTHYRGESEAEAGKAQTGVEIETLKMLIEHLSEVPAWFNAHPKLERILEQRRRNGLREQIVDWTTAESLALASLAAEGIPIRLTGQDTERGTFSQRHAVWHDVESGGTYMPLSHVAPQQAPVEIINSPLSEAGVLGFEYGYSLDRPEGLIMWEAQFGDFANAAQVVIDQFIASAEAKWRRLSGLTLLLPHGYEGQGPEHSSARLERFLMLCANDNMQVVYPSTPAQYFHCLRRQVLRPWRKPLVIMTPKSLLRHRQCVSTLSELARGRFRGVRGESLATSTSNHDRLLLCTGKVYYDLEQRRRELGLDGPAIARVEQLYPLPKRELCGALAMVDDHARVTWVQEEPLNMGAWWFIRANWEQLVGNRYPLDVVARPVSASPATGSKRTHEREQQELLDCALKGNNSPST